MVKVEAELMEHTQQRFKVNVVYAIRDITGYGKHSRADSYGRNS